MEIGSILFGAGEGTRLRPLTGALAKPAVPILDVPLGAWGLGALLHSASPVVVNASHQVATLDQALRSVHPIGWELFDEGPVGFGTAGTVAALADRAGDELIVYNGDLIADIDLEALRTAHRAGGASITLTVAEVDSAADVAIAGGRVARFIDRRKENERGARYLGVALLGRDAVASIPKTRPLGLGESVFAPLAEKGGLAAYVHDGYALDAGTIDRFIGASVDCLTGVAPAPPVAFPGEMIEVNGGRVYLGPGASAGGTLGPGAVLLRNARVREGAHVEKAIVFPHETVPSGSDVRGAVWFEGAAIRGPSTPPAS